MKDIFENIEQRLELSLLYDFYGALLKENQKRMFEAYIIDDLNYTEIASEEGISRQGAYDSIKRAVKQLKEYEDKLGLYKKFKSDKEEILHLKNDLINMGIDPKNKEWLKIFNRLDSILDSNPTTKN